MRSRSGILPRRLSQGVLATLCLEAARLPVAGRLARQLRRNGCSVLSPFSCCLQAVVTATELNHTMMRVLLLHNVGSVQPRALQTEVCEDGCCTEWGRTCSLSVLLDRTPSPSHSSLTLLRTAGKITSASHLPCNSMQNTLLRAVRRVSVHSVQRNKYPAGAPTDGDALMGHLCAGPGRENCSLGVLSENTAKDKSDKWETEIARKMSEF